MAKDFSPIKGTTDYTPAEMLVRESARQIILESYRKNGYSLIKTPILENLNFLMGSEGGENLRLIFKTLKRGEKLDLSKPNLTEADIAEEGLRYDLTVPLIRFYSKNRDKLPIPFKAIQMDDVFRAERPQKGRSRQFTQCDIDIVGDSSINAEIDLIYTILETYKKLKFDNLTIKVNDRRILNQIIAFCGFSENDTEHVLICIDKLDKIGHEGLKNSLTEDGYPIKNIEKLVVAISTISEQGIACLTQFGVDEELKNNMATLLNALNKNLPTGCNVVFDISIVRGQSYYTGTVFEAYTEGFARAIGGGGRYDKIMGKVSGIDVPMVGFSIGFEPCCMLMLERGVQFETNKNLALIYNADESFDNVLNCKKQLMEEYNVSLYVRPKNLKNLLTKLKDSGFTFFCFFDKNSKNQVISPIE